MLSEEGKIKRKAAKSLHEVFVMYKESDEDLTLYKECFIDLLADDNVKIIVIVNGYLSKVLFNWVNNFGKNKENSLDSDSEKKEPE